MRGSILFSTAVVLAGALAGVLGQLPPAPAPADAPAHEFSAARAAATVRAFADRPHPIGTPGHALVRQRIVTALTELGLEPSVSRRAVVYDHPRREETATRVGWPRNIVARLPGDGSRRGPGEAIALMAHYDSVPTGHGAADAMSGVASILEALRALRATPAPLARDVLVVITDGEEVGLLGAQAFFREDPRASEPGLVLNLEARGAAGVASMFETGPANGGWVRAFGRAAPWPVASSLSVEVYRRMPNDTDATIALAAGIPTFNFAFIDDYYRYHAGADVPANLSRRSLQHEGDNLLALVRHFGHAAWPRSTGDATYFSLGRRTLVSYGPALALALSLLAGGVAVLALVLLARAGRWFDPLVGAGALLAILVAGFNFAMGLYVPARAATPSFHLFYQYHPLLAAWVGAGVAMLALALSPAATRRGGLLVLVLSALLAGVATDALSTPLIPLSLAALVLALPRGAPSHRALLGGALLLWLLATGVATALALHAAYVFAWPLLAASVAALWLTAGKRDSPAAFPLWLPLAASLVLWLPLAYGVYLGVAVRVPGVISLLTALLLALAAPLFARPQARRVLLASAAATLLIVPWAVHRDPFSARFPQPVEVFLAQDLDAGRGWWMSRGARLNGPERDALGDEARAFEVAEWSPDAPGRGWRVRAAVAPPAPSVLDVRREATGESWTLALTVRPAQPGARIVLTVDPATFRAATLDGAAVPVPRLTEAWRWDFWGVDPERPIAVQLRGTGPPPGRVRLDEYRFGVLDSAGLAPRPAHTMAAPWSLDRGVWQRRTVPVP